MAQAYLYVNALLYAAMAVWTTVAPTRAATRLGYVVPTQSGQSEFLTVYGGMQVGLAVLFFLLARDVSTSKLGLLVAMGFYLPVLSYRVVTGVNQFPAHGLLRGAVLVEGLLLLLAVILYFRIGR